MIFRVAFFTLFLLLFAMRVYFMVRVRRSGGRIMPDKDAINREGGRGVFLIRMIGFFAILAFLLMYFLGAKWIDAFLFPVPDWLRWVGFAVGLITVIFWTWVQITLDTQWSAQLQLREDHHLITTGPYARIRHPLYAGVVGWCVSISLLTANWIFVAVCALSVVGLLYRAPKEEQMMLDAFGEEYKSYMNHTGRFFPKF